MKEATAAISAAKAQFLIELGDFKDTNPQKNVTDTLGFLDDIEKAVVEGFKSPHFHVLGNHDVDILNQTQVMQHVKNFGQTDSKAYYSFDGVQATTQNDTEGCLLHADGGKDNNVWLVHSDGTRNWLSRPTPGCFNNSLGVADINIYVKRHGGVDAYSLNEAQSKVACATNKACSAAPAAGVPSGMHYVVLNGDFNAKGEAWYDLDSQSTKFSWSQPWLPSEQMQWLQVFYCLVVCIYLIACVAPVGLGNGQGQRPEGDRVYPLSLGRR